jgi:hypothetical protein
MCCNCHLGATVSFIDINKDEPDDWWKGKEE